MQIVPEAAILGRAYIHCGVTKGRLGCRNSWLVLTDWVTFKSFKLHYLTHSLQAEHGHEPYTTSKQTPWLACRFRRFFNYLCVRRERNYDYFLLMLKGVLSSLLQEVTQKNPMRRVNRTLLPEHRNNAKFSSNILTKTHLSANNEVEKNLHLKMQLVTESANPEKREGWNGNFWILKSGVQFHVDPVISTQWC